MKKLNQIPIKTTNNFGVNTVDIDFLIPSTFDFDDYKTHNLNIKSSIKNKLFSKIGLEVPKYLDSTIELDKYVEYKEPIILIKDLNDNLADKITIKALKNSKANIILLYRGKNVFHYLVIDGEIEENACVNLSIVNLLDNDSKIFTSVSNIIKENAELHTNIIDLEGHIKVSNYYSNIIGQNGKDYLKSIYFGQNNDIIDINYDIKNKGRNTISDIETVGCLTDNASKTMKMSIDFVTGAAKSVGKEIEKCILLSDNVTSKSVPLLLCTEEDVQGVHSVATGKVDYEKVFYIMSRGFSYKDAIKIIINGDLNNIISNINDNKIKDEVLKKINDFLE